MSCLRHCGVSRLEPSALTSLTTLYGPEMTMGHTFRPATHDYSRVMTTDYCRFQSGPLNGSALKIKHNCHKITCSWNLVNLITSTDPWPTRPTQICWPTWPVTRDPLTNCHLWYGLLDLSQHTVHSLDDAIWSLCCCDHTAVSAVVRPYSTAPSAPRPRPSSDDPAGSLP